MNQTHSHKDVQKSYKIINIDAKQNQKVQNYIKTQIQQAQNELINIENEIIKLENN